MHNNQPESNGIQQGTPKVIGSDGRNGTPPGDKVRQTDKIEISENGKKVSELMSFVNKLPDIRADRVEAIKEAIESGNYGIDSLKIAEKILTEL